MSGLEVAGVLLGTFPLIIHGVEQWREVAKIGGFYWRVQKQYTECMRDVKYHEIIFKHNLKDLLSPIHSDANELQRLVDDPNGKGWGDKDLQQRLEHRLSDSYELYIHIVEDMKETAQTLRKELAMDKGSIQDKLLTPPSGIRQKQSISTQLMRTSSKATAAKAKWDWETFRIRFSFNDPTRKELFARMEEGNRRLKKLLSSSDKLSAVSTTSVPHTKSKSTLESVLKKAWYGSDHLFNALKQAWQCSCQQYHFANLRLEHRTLPETCFEVILNFHRPDPKESIAWNWQGLQCGRIPGCISGFLKPACTSQTSGMRAVSVEVPRKSINVPRVKFDTSTFILPTVEVESPNKDVDIQLCQVLRKGEPPDCIGVIGHGVERYHLHPFEKQQQPKYDRAVSLDQVLSHDFGGQLSRRQRYLVALLVSSSIAQLQFTPWIKDSLKKEDVLFFPCDEEACDIPFHEPFIRQGFESDDFAPESKDCNFYSLGILLLELCFGKRLEDHPLRKRFPDGQDKVAKQALDVVAALKWSQGVSDEGGEDFAGAVKWCFVGAANRNQNWQGEIIKNVIQPLELCQQHFKAAIGS